MATINIGNAAQQNALLSSILGLNGGNGAALQVLPPPAAQTARDSCSYNIYNFTKLTTYGILNALNMMGENNVPINNILELLYNMTSPNAPQANPALVCVQLNTFYKAIFTPYTGVTLNASPNLLLGGLQHLQQRFLACVITPLLVNVNEQGTQRCGPVAFVAGGEAITSYTYYKYHSYKTKDSDICITHKDYYLAGNNVQQRWNYSSPIITNFRATGDPALLNIAANQQLNPIPVDVRMYLFRCLLFFLLDLITNSFLINQTTPVPAQGAPYPGEYARGNRIHPTSCNITRAQVTTNWPVQINWSNVFSGAQRLTAVDITNSLTSVMSFLINFNVDGTPDNEAIIESPIISRNRSQAVVFGNTENVYRFMDPNMNQCIRAKMRDGEQGETITDVDGPANYMYTTLIFNPTTRRPPPANVVPFVAHGLNQSWLNLVSGTKRISHATIAYSLFDLFKMLLIADILSRQAGGNQARLLKYKQKLSYLLVTLNTTDNSQTILNKCQDRRIRSNNQTPPIDMYLGGGTGGDFEQTTENTMGASLLEMKPEINTSNDVDTSKDVDTSNDAEIDEFDTLTETDKKEAIAFSESLYKKMTEIGLEKMNEYISTFKTDAKNEFYGYLNYLSFNDPMWKDYRLGFIDFDKFGQAGTPTGYKIEEHLQESQEPQGGKSRKRQTLITKKTRRRRVR